MSYGDIADGKVTGDFLGKNQYSGLIEDYYRIHREYGADGFLCGRVTMEGSFPQPAVLPAVYDGPPIAREDYVAERTAFYAVAISIRKASFGGTAVLLLTLMRAIMVLISSSY